MGEHQPIVTPLAKPVLQAMHLALGGTDMHPTRLSSLIRQDSYNIDEPCHIDIDIAACAKVHLIDDSDQLGFTDLTLTLILQNNSHVIYRAHSVDSPRTMLVNLPLTSTIKSTHEHEFKRRVHIILQGVESTFDLIASYFVGTKRKIRLITIQDHQAPASSSNVEVRGAFEGDAQFTCDNLIHIGKGAQKTTATQVNKNLLLSNKARAISIPKMEVETNDVSCKHGAATSKISEDQLFYLQSRGLSSAFAIELVISSFLA